MCEWTRKKFVGERKMIDFQKLKVSKSALLADFIENILPLLMV
jgi:hypothetical protein